MTAGNDAAPVNGSKALANLNWPTVALILISGGGNLLLTQEKTSNNHAEIDRAIRQIREMHDNLGEFEKTQQQELDGISQALKNQNKIMDKQTDTLEYLHNVVRVRQGGIPSKNE